jgi:hypothetical protein
VLCARAESANEVSIQTLDNPSERAALETENGDLGYSSKEGRVSGWNDAPSGTDGNLSTPDGFLSRPLLDYLWHSSTKNYMR